MRENISDYEIPFELFPKLEDSISVDLCNSFEQFKCILGKSINEGNQGNEEENFNKFLTNSVVEDIEGPFVPQQSENDKSFNEFNPQNQFESSGCIDFQNYNIKEEIINPNSFFNDSFYGNHPWDEKRNFNKNNCSDLNNLVWNESTNIQSKINISNGNSNISLILDKKSDFIDSQIKMDRSYANSTLFLNKKRGNDLTSEITPSKNLFKCEKLDESNITNKSSKKYKYGIVHDKFTYDNIAKKIKNLSFEYSTIKLNEVLKNINKESENKKFLSLCDTSITKNHYKDLMNQTFSTIFSQNISKVYNKNKKNQNEELINNIYESYKRGKKEYSNIVKFLDLKYGDFWKYLTFFLKYKHKTLNGRKFINEIDEDNLFLNEIMEDFLDFIDKKIKMKKSKKKNKEKIKFYKDKRKKDKDKKDEEKKEDEAQYKMIIELQLQDFHIWSQERHFNFFKKYFPSNINK